MIRPALTDAQASARLLLLYPADGNQPLSSSPDYVDFDSDDPEDAARWLRESDE